MNRRRWKIIRRTLSLTVEFFEIKKIVLALPAVVYAAAYFTVRAIKGKESWDMAGILVALIPWAILLIVVFLWKLPEARRLVRKDEEIEGLVRPLLESLPDFMRVLLARLNSVGSMDSLEANSYLLERGFDQQGISLSSLNSPTVAIVVPDVSGRRYRINPVFEQFIHKFLMSGR